MTVFEKYDSANSTWVDISDRVGAGWTITHGVSDVQIAPEATVPTQRGVVSAGQRIRITSDTGTDMFEGDIQRAPVTASGTGGGSVKAEAEHDAFRLFDDPVSVSITSHSSGISSSKEPSNRMTPLSFSSTTTNVVSVFLIVLTIISPSVLNYNTVIWRQVRRVARILKHVDGDGISL